MKAYQGIVTAGDRGEKTITVTCPEGISGAELGKDVLIVPLKDDCQKYLSEESLLKMRLEEILTERMGVQ